MIPLTLKVVNLRVGGVINPHRYLRSTPVTLYQSLRSPPERKDLLFFLFRLRVLLFRNKKREKGRTSTYIMDHSVVDRRSALRFRVYFLPPCPCTYLGLSDSCRNSSPWAQPLGYRREDKMSLYSGYEQIRWWQPIREGVSAYVKTME